MKNYFVSGEINSRPIKSHSFSSEAKAFKFLGKLLNDNNLQVETDLRMADNTEEFICSYHTRFFIGRI